ncbi:MAG: hypothetical protein ACFHWX_02420 [Bacteroidota bacterium]
MRLLTLIAIPVILISCSTKKDGSASSESMKASAPSYKLEKLWETDTLLRTPESVLYDSARDVIYVANVNMNPWEKDENGFISKISTSGEIVDLEWVTGLSGPKGMGLVGTSLFVNDITDLVEINVETGEIIKRTALEGAVGLNDITTDCGGTLYISDSNGDKIYKYANGTAEVFMSGMPSKPNGQLFDGDNLYTAFAGAHQFSAINLESKEMTVVADSIGAGDGITPTTEPGVYLVSDWTGEIWIIGDFGKQSLLQTRDQGKNTADIWFIADQELVLVPTFFDNKVVAYKLVKG